VSSGITKGHIYYLDLLKKKFEPAFPSCSGLSYSSLKFNLNTISI
jgi:hypothetical protein